MIKQIKNNVRSDDGASATIELIIIMILLFICLMSVIDYGVYFNNRNVITNTAQNGARLAAVYGGSGDTPVAREYGVRNVTSECSRVGAKDNVSCSVFNELKETKGLTNVTIHNVTCGPNKTSKIGERTYCSISWSNRSVGGSLSFANLIKRQETRMTAESEVVAK